MEGLEGMFIRANLERHRRSSLLLTGPAREARLDGAAEKCWKLAGPAGRGVTMKVSEVVVAVFNGRRLVRSVFERVEKGRDEKTRGQIGGCTDFQGCLGGHAGNIIWSELSRSRIGVPDACFAGTTMVDPTRTGLRAALEASTQEWRLCFGK